MSDNPFQIPDSNLEPEMPDPDGFHAPVTCPGGQGTVWFSKGWQLFSKSPLMLVVLTLLMFVTAFLVMLVPILGMFVVILFWPHMLAGLYLALEHADRGEPVSLGDLYRPLRDPGYLLGIGAVMFAVQILVMLISMVFFVGGMGMSNLMSAFSHPHTAEMQMRMATPGLLWSLLGWLISLALSIPLGMAILFSPILAFRHRVPPIEAMKLSFMGCWHNFLPLLIWSLVWFVAGIALILTFFIPFIGILIAILAAFIVFPLSLANIYCAWKDIYVR